MMSFVAEGPCTPITHAEARRRYESGQPIAAAGERRWFERGAPATFFTKASLGMSFDQILPSRGGSFARPLPNCSCAHNLDGTVTPTMCPLHANMDPCLTVSRVTGRRRKGSIAKGSCTNCGWGSV